MLAIVCSRFNFDEILEELFPATIPPCESQLNLNYRVLVLGWDGAQAVGGELLTLTPPTQPTLSVCCSPRSAQGIY